LEPASQPNLRLVESFAVAGARLLSEACRLGFECIVSKRRIARSLWQLARLAQGHL
jgi:hypothetical protein